MNKHIILFCFLMLILLSVINLLFLFKFNLFGSMQTEQIAGMKSEYIEEGFTSNASITIDVQEKNADIEKQEAEPTNAQLIKTETNNKIQVPTKRYIPLCPFECCPAKDDDFIPDECENENEECVIDYPPGKGYRYICAKKECPYECCDGTVYLEKNCSLFFECAGNSCITANPDKIIENTFKSKNTFEDNFIVQEALRFCNNVSDCALIALDNCALSNLGHCGYINSLYKNKWDENLTLWKQRMRLERPGEGGCFTAQTHTSPPQCINNLCVWKEGLASGC